MNYSKIAYLGMLNQYSKYELIEKLKGYVIHQVHAEFNSEIIRFQGDGVIIDIRFDLFGKFIRIEGEKWLNPPMEYRVN